MSAALLNKLQNGDISAVIFDLDGVLIDSTAGIADCTNYCLREIGRDERSVEEIKRYIGSPLPEMFADFAPGVEYAEIRPHFKIRARDVIVNSTELLPYARETITQLKFAGLQIGIGSTKVRSHISGIVEKFGLESDIESYTGGDEATPKPAPDIFLITCQRLGVAPESTLVVGDTINDTLAAMSAGMHIVSIESDLGDSRLMQETPSERHFNSLYDFTEYVMAALRYNA